MSRAGQAAPLEGALAAIPLGDEGIAWQGESQINSDLLAERSAAGEVHGPAGGTTVVKPGPHRAVYRVKLPSATVFLKHFKIADGRACCWAAPARREVAAVA